MTLPCSVDGERFVLGSILLDGSHFVTAASALEADDFSLESHRRIWRAMEALTQKGVAIDRVTVMQAIMDRGDLEAVGGFSYLVDLDSGLPPIRNIDDYIRILRDKATLRRIVFASQHLMAQASEPGAEPGDLLARATSGLLKLAEQGQDSTLLTPAEIIAAAGTTTEYLIRSNRPAGLSTGYPTLDAMLGGLRPGAMYVLAARPRMGKTALALNIAEKVAINHENTVLVFSLEMSGDQLIDRMICSRARVNTKRFEGGWMDAEETERAQLAMGDIGHSTHLLIDDKCVTSMSEIHSKIRKQQQRGPVGLVVIDYLQLLIDGDSKFRVAEASRISRDMKLVARDCEVPIIALSQLSRKCDERDDHRPQLADLRETGSIEQDADVVMFVYREEVYYPDRPELRGLADLIIGKQRSGPEGPIPMLWMGDIVRFEERSK